MAMVIELCDGFGDQTSITHTNVGRYGAVMVMRLCGIDSVRGHDQMIVNTLINGHA